MSSIKGFTYISTGDPFDPDMIKVLGHNDSVPLGEKRVMAAFAKGDKTVFYKYLAVGSGNTTDFTDPLAPPTNQYIIDNYFSVAGGPENRLFTEFYRVPLFRSTFIDSLGNPTNDITDEILLIWQIPNDEATGVWRELAIFGGTADEELNSGIMVHYQTIADFSKTPFAFAEKLLNFHWVLKF